MDDESGSGDCRAGGRVCGGGTSARVFVTSNGPDVHVVLVRADDRALEQEVVKGELEHVELGAPKGNQGNHNYDLPATVDLNQYQAVAIYCESFRAIFGARLEKF